MKKFFLIIALASILFSGCGLFGGGKAANTNQKPAVTDDPKDVPKFASAKEAIDKGDEYLDGGLYKKAINAFKQAVALEPENGEGHFKLGVAFALEEDVQDLPPGVEGNSDKSFKNAVTVYKKYLRENPDDAEAWFNLGRAQGKLFDDKSAANSMAKAVKLDDENALYKTEYGAALIKLARYREAIRQLDKALELDPQNLYAEDLLEKAQSGKKRVDFKQPEKTPSNTNVDENGGAANSASQSNTSTKPAATPKTTKTVPPTPAGEQ